ncbi:hypothetical protein RB620_18720 [Paenibacillus sp. LHD-117]|nr:hypothetical protein [Paenibacillus sp. LHD-117]MDQ6421462.1 hypothetical protein [Paenibacillus sp. LHD-117]
MRSLHGRVCEIAEADGLSVMQDGEEIAVQRLKQGGIWFTTETGRTYRIRPFGS